MKITDHEIRVLKMMNGDEPWEYGSWVNACVEFLGEMGYCLNRAPHNITDKGRQFLKDLSNDVE